MDGRANNSGSKGNKGGGRRSAYQEHHDAEWLAKVWGEDQDITTLADKVKRGRFCAKDVATLMILQGDKHLMSKIIDKLLPDLRKEESKMTFLPPETQGLSDDEKTEILKMFPSIA